MLTLQQVRQNCEKSKLPNLHERAFVTDIRNEEDVNRLDKELSQEIEEHGHVRIEVWIERR